MSRIGKQPIPIPANVNVTLEGQSIAIEGPNKAKLTLDCHPKMIVKVDESAKQITVERPNDDRENRALHGLTRSLIANMVEGVTKGFSKKLKVEGIGYQARQDGKGVALNVGFANTIVCTPPEGVKVTVSDATTILVEGADKQKVGQFAAEVRHAHPPEPYKGKGIRYEDEVPRRKEGKAFASGG